VDVGGRCCQHCGDIVKGISILPGAEVLWMPTLNQGLVRFVKQDFVGNNQDVYCEADHKRYTSDVLAAVNASGKTFFSGTTWRGKYAIRVSVVNWRTTSQDVRITVEAVKEALEEVQRAYKST
jgi:glutamate/tyrosine decarboxylase-like PLP-dependent enzyme